MTNRTWKESRWFPALLIVALLVVSTILDFRQGRARDFIRLILGFGYLCGVMGSFIAVPVWWQRGADQNRFQQPIAIDLVIIAALLALLWPLTGMYYFVLKTVFLPEEFAKVFKVK